MKKKLAIALLGICTIATLQALKPWEQKEQVPTLQLKEGVTFVDKNPGDVHIFFDAHGVLVERTLWTFIKGGMFNLFATKETFKEKAYLAGQFVQVLCNPNFYRGLRDLLGNPKGKNKITESYLNMIGALGYKDVREALIQFANNVFVTNRDILPLLAKLKSRGYNLHLFSNIGAEIFEDAQQRNLFPELFGDKGYFEHNTINFTAPESGTYTTWKPQPEAYTQALSNAGAQAEESIMIEDKLKNLPTVLGIKAAQKKKTRATQKTEQWTAGILYRNQNEAENAFKELGLIN